MKGHTKPLYFILFFLAVFTILTGCTNPQSEIEAQGGKSGNGTDPSTVHGDHREKEKKEEEDPMMKIVESMTTKEKIGQMIMIGLETDTVTEMEQALIRENHIGGVILFQRNIKNADGLVNINNQLKTINKDHSGIPIFISVDEEGGIVSRMPPEVKNLPNAMEIGATGDVLAAEQAGAAIGERVAGFGLNMTMAPVLDVNTNPNNPVIGVRSFGDQPEVVAKMGIAEMKAIQNEKVIPVVKHFPGHGDTEVDSHIGLPTVNHDIDRLRRVELAPFKQAINEGADAVMVGHIILSAYDAMMPSSLSDKVIEQLLRKDLGFRGVVMTDDLTMGAIIENGSIDEAAVQAVLAGNDLLIISHGYENQLNAIQSIEQAVTDGRIGIERLEKSVYRILKLKEKYKLKDEEIQSVDIEKINRSSQNVLQYIQS